MKNNFLMKSPSLYLSLFLSNALRKCLPLVEFFSLCCSCPLRLALKGNCNLSWLATTHYESLTVSAWVYSTFASIYWAILLIVRGSQFGSIHCSKNRLSRCDAKCYKKTWMYLPRHQLIFRYSGTSHSPKGDIKVKVMGLRYECFIEREGSQFSFLQLL